MWTKLLINKCGTDGPRVEEHCVLWLDVWPFGLLLSRLWLIRHALFLRTIAPVLGFVLISFSSPSCTAKPLCVLVLSTEELGLSPWFVACLQAAALVLLLPISPNSAATLPAAFILHSSLAWHSTLGFVLVSSLDAKLCRSVVWRSQGAPVIS